MDVLLWLFLLIIHKNTVPSILKTKYIQSEFSNLTEKYAKVKLSKHVSPCKTKLLLKAEVCYISQIDRYPTTVLGGRDRLKSNEAPCCLA